MRREFLDSDDDKHILWIHEYSSRMVFVSPAPIVQPTKVFNSSGSSLGTQKETRQPQAQVKKTPRNGVYTLRPDRFNLVDQPILDLSNKQTCWLQIASKSQLPAAKSEGFTIHFSRVGAPSRFPTITRGVFYFHHVPGDTCQSQLRFRLCGTLAEFQDGEDLQLPGGGLWNVSLKTLARAPNTYRTVLALLQDEFRIRPQDVDNHNCHRLISTFDPEKLQSSGQGIMNISGLTGARLHMRSDASSVLLYRPSKREKNRLPTAVAYPPDTIGVFYYHQCQTAPTRLGELRFRLCRNVREFDKGTDLCLPSGQPWSLSSLNIHVTSSHKNLHECLTRDGLLENTMYPNVPQSLLTTLTMPLRVLGDPFVVDLSATALFINIVSTSPTTAMQKVCIS
ncbi:hypothetical protein D9619_008855 [Psilocybe cf. subviscida]|uniref:Uncharacterized protein n=1 Tax=Psilocybe cf. subviscida TaxID=2480587 RepID=A0A8H5F0Z3_9AGAR|nr:hypothetical protein D9619_008855 [Psilocybe cf. subviscida]